MATDTEILSCILNAIGRLPPDAAKQIFDAIEPRDGDISREAQALLSLRIGSIWQSR